MSLMDKWIGTKLQKLIQPLESKQLNLTLQTKLTILTKGHALAFLVKSGLPRSPVGSGCAPMSVSVMIQFMMPYFLL